MKKANQPTEEQIKFFEKYGLKILPSKESCNRLIKWIVGGGSEAGRRIGIVRAAQEKYIGKRVRNYEGTKMGTALYIFYLGFGPRGQGDPHRGKFTHPLEVMVKWDNGRTTKIAIGSVRLLEGENNAEV